MWALSAYNLGRIVGAPALKAVTCCKYYMSIVGMRCAKKRLEHEALRRMHGKGATIGKMVRLFFVRAGKHFLPFLQK